MRIIVCVKILCHKVKNIHFIPYLLFLPFGQVMQNNGLWGISEMFYVRLLLPSAFQILIVLKWLSPFVSPQESNKPRTVLFQYNTYTQSVPRTQVKNLPAVGDPLSQLEDPLEKQQQPHPSSFLKRKRENRETTSTGSRKKLRGISENIYFACFRSITKAVDCVIHNNCEKFQYMNK